MLASSHGAVPSSRWIVAACASLSLACHGDPPGDDPDADTSSTTSLAGAPGSDDGESSTSAGIVDGPPEVLDVGRSVSSLTEDDAVVLTAFVRHPRGDAAVVSGTVHVGSDDVPFARFERLQGGRWSLPTSWGQIALHAELHFEDEGVAQLTASFVDDAGLVGELDFDVPLHCPFYAPIACVNRCLTSC